MVIQTTRFGQVEISTEDLISFPEGVVGFNQLKSFVLLDDPTDDIFAWLQSCEEPAIAFPVLEPELFSSQYKVNLTKSDLEALGMSTSEGIRIFCIVTIPEDVTKMTANLKAPVVINLKDRRARQCVLQDNGLAIREPMFVQLQQRVVQNPEKPIKSSTSDIGVIVRIPGPEKDQTL